MFFKDKNNNFRLLSTKYVCTYFVDVTLALRPENAATPAFGVT